MPRSYVRPHHRRNGAFRTTRVRGHYRTIGPVGAPVGAPGCLVAVAVLVALAVVSSVLAAAVAGLASLTAAILSLPLWLLIPATLVVAVAVGGIIWAAAEWYRADREQKAAQRRAQEEAARQAWLHQQAEAERVRQAWLAKLRTLEGLRALTPTEFEHAVGQMLVAHGYRDVTRTGGAGDLMADLTCTSADGRRAVIQCKRYGPESPIGSPEIQKFIGMVTVHHRAHLGIFVTSSSFTEPAKRLGEQHRGYLQLVDGDLLAVMMQRVQATPVQGHAPQPPG